MSWRMKLAFLIAGKELYAWRSKHNRIVAKMATSMTEGRIIKLLEGIAITTKNDEVAVMELLSAIVALIKGEQK